MKKIIVLVFALCAGYTAFADSPEHAKQQAYWDCDNQGGKTAKFVGQSYPEKDGTIYYHSTYKDDSNNIGSQQSFEERGGYNSTYAGATQTGSRQDNRREETHEINGAVHYICVDE